MFVCMPLCLLWTLDKRSEHFDQIEFMLLNPKFLFLSMRNLPLKTSTAQWL